MRRDKTMHRGTFGTDAPGTTRLATRTFARQGNADAWHESLYRTRLAVHFVTFDGDPSQAYVRRLDNDTQHFGDGLFWVSLAAAVEWARGLPSSEIDFDSAPELLESTRKLAATS